LAIATNWVIYIWAVNHDHVVEAALGYFINPLVTVAIGVVALGERLRRAQWIAVGLGLVAVAVLTAAYGRVPWISLVLAASFASYGYLKKLVPFGPTESLTVETAFLAPIAIVIFAVLGANGTAAFGSAGWSNTVLLILTGPVTTVPLLLFAASARRIPLTLLGLLQYLTPVGQFLCGVLVFHEQLSTARWIGFGLVWAALVILTTDAFRDTRRPALAPVEVG
jgi:chloramphenicol-sensitive protein RarD